MEGCSSEIDSIAIIAMDNFSLQNFLRTFLYFFALPKPNTATRFCLVDVL